MSEVKEKSSWRELLRPFEPGEISVKVQTVSRDRKKGLVVPYVDARSVMERLDETLGVENWSDTYTPMPSGEGVVAVKCRLTVLGISKEDAGIGDDAKAACSDALKRAAVKFGVGRHLYESNRVWANLDVHGAITDSEAVKARVLGLAEPKARNGRRASVQGDADLPF